MIQYWKVVTRRKKDRKQQSIVPENSIDENASYRCLSGGKNPPVMRSISGWKLRKMATYYSSCLGLGAGGWQTQSTETPSDMTTNTKDESLCLIDKFVSVI